MGFNLIPSPCLPYRSNCSLEFCVNYFFSGKKKKTCITDHMYMKTWKIQFIFVCLGALQMSQIMLVCSLLQQAFFTQYYVSKIPLHSWLRPCLIHLHGRIGFHYMDMASNLLIYEFTFLLRALAWFLSFAFLSGTTANALVSFSWCLDAWVSLGFTLSNEIKGSKAAQFSLHYEHKRIRLLQAFTNTCHCHYLLFCRKSHCGINLHFPNDYNVEHLSFRFMSHSYFLLWNACL